jgi:hypothetical protein
MSDAWLPGPEDAPAHVAAQLREQAEACAVMGSPLYARLLERAAQDVLERGPLWSVLSAHLAPGRGNAVALRLMAAVHRLVLTGAAPALAAFYPSAGGGGDVGSAWPAFRALVAERADLVTRLVERRCQTNEVGRAAALAHGFLELAATHTRPLRLLEVGASAGLNLRWDRFRYAGGGVAWGDVNSPVDLTGLWHDPPRQMPSAVAIAERSGCDLAPLDPLDPEAVLALRSSVWADQTTRLLRLEGSLAVAASEPATVEPASAEAWVAERLERPAPGTVTVVYHSVVAEYLPAPVFAAFERTLHAAGARACVETPLAWLRLEPSTSVRHHALTLTEWPGGRERRLALCGAHGDDVRRAD